MVFTPPKDLYTRKHYDKVLKFLGAEFPPAAMRMHVIGTTAEGEVRIVDIFENAEDFERFAESHAPVYEEMGISLDDVLKHASVFEIDKTINK